ncbi:unnamed protein product [Peniophora sp. CBMAI 1063]|nr:unnamed protein product [Peniophora sp. CBMAI 1063]
MAKLHTERHDFVYLSFNVLIQGNDPASTMSSQDPVNLLNDILNKRKSSHLLSWEFQQAGPGHNPVHVAIAKGGRGFYFEAWQSRIAAHIKVV